MSQRLPPHRRGDDATDTDDDDSSVSVALEVYDEREYGQVDPKELRGAARPMTWCDGSPGFVVSPYDWGAAYAQRYDPAYGRQVITPCTKLVIHHSASNQPPAGGEVSFSRQLEAYGESRDGAACEYNFMLYPSGVLHGGFGDTRGCHASATDPSTGSTFNSTSVGFCFIGYFHPPNNDEPTAEAIATFQAWLGWMIDSGRLTDDVLTHAPTSGQPGWYGHRDLWATACPGDSLYPLLPSIVQIGSAPAPGPMPTPGGNDLVNTLFIIDDAYARFAGDADAQGIVHTVRYLGPWLNQQIGFESDNVTPRIAGTKVLHRKQREMNTITLVGPKPTGDKVDWTDDNFYQGA